MNKNINSKTLGVIGGMVLLIGVVAGFYWLWTGTTPDVSSNIVVDSRYQQVEIDSVKKDAENLLADRNKSTAVPVKAPSSDKTGKANPFQ